MNTAVEFFKRMMEISLFASAMIVMVLLIKAMAGDKIDIRVVSFLWFFVMLRLCVPGMLESPVHIDGLFYEKAVAQPITSAYVQDNRVKSTFGGELTNKESIPPIWDVNAVNPVAGEPQPVHLSLWKRVGHLIRTIDLWSLATIIWIVGGVIVLLSSFKENLAFRLYVKKNSDPIKDKEILEIIDAHRRTNRIQRNVRISTCPSIYMPMAIGFFKPQILLPVHMAGKMKREYIHTILLHEVCHIRRNDILKGYFCILAKALHWFNPLVWVSIRNIKEDIEFSCDQRVLRLMNRERGVQYCESLVYAARFMNQVRAPQFASLLCGNRSNLKRRIMKMIRPQKQSKAVAAVSLMIALVMAVSCFTTACQPTPEKAPIVGKNDGKLADEISQSQGSSQNDYPANWTHDFQNDEGDVSIIINAPLEVPNVSAYPVVNVVPTEITKDDIEKLVQYFFDGKPVYDLPPEPSKSLLTKRLLQYKFDLETLQESGKVHYTTHIFTPEEIPEELSILQGKIDDYESELSSAEDTQRNMSTLDLISKGEYKKCNVVDTTLGDYKSSFSVNIKNGNYLSTITYSTCDSGYGDFEAPVDEKPHGMDMTLGEAEDLAKEMLADIGIEEAVRTDWLVGNYTGLDEKFIGMKNSEQCYVFYFCRPVGGVPVTYFYDYEGTSTFGADGGAYYVYPWDPEIIEVYVNNQGVLKFMWQNPGTITDTINPNVALLPWEDIKEKAIQQFSIKDIDLYLMGYDQERISISISKITLGMMRVAKKDSMEEYMYIPVWDFFGHYIIERDNSDSYSERACSMLTINAIDGSIIDRGLGY